MSIKKNIKNKRNIRRNIRTREIMNRGNKLTANFKKFNNNYNVNIFSDNLNEENKKIDKIAKINIKSTTNINIRSKIKIKVKMWLKEKLPSHSLGKIVQNKKNSYSAFVFKSLISNNIAATEKGYFSTYRELLKKNFELNDNKCTKQKVVLQRINNAELSDDSDTNNPVYKNSSKKDKRLKAINNTENRFNFKLKNTKFGHQMLIILKLIDKICSKNINNCKENCKNINLITPFNPDFYYSIEWQEKNIQDEDHDFYIKGGIIPSSYSEIEYFLIQNSNENITKEILINISKKLTLPLCEEIEKILNKNKKNIKNLNIDCKNHANLYIKRNQIDSFDKYKLDKNQKDKILKAAGKLWLLAFIAEPYREKTLKIQSASYKKFQEKKY